MGVRAPTIYRQLIATTWGKKASYFGAQQPAGRHSILRKMPNRAFSLGKPRLQPQIATQMDTRQFQQL
jgi:hypothetical protein